METNFIFPLTGSKNRSEAARVHAITDGIFNVDDLNSPVSDVGGVIGAGSKTKIVVGA